MPDFGKYALFVWPSFGLAALVMVVLAVSSWRHVRDQEKLLSALERKP